MTRARAAWGLAAVDVAAYVVGSVLDPYTEFWPGVLFGMVIASFVVIGALLYVRVPGNPIGSLLLIAGTLQAFGAAIGTYADLGANATPPWPGFEIAAVLGSGTFTIPIVIALIGVPLIFPDGRFPSPRYRWIAWLAVVAMTTQLVVDLFGSGTVGATEIPNPLAIDAAQPLLDVLAALVSISSIVGFGGAVAAVWTRYRHGSPVIRQQTKWLVAVAAVAAAVFPLAFLLSDPAPELGNVFFIIGVLTMVALPIAIGVAILRYRLYDIDRIISRTVSYATVTVVIGAVFAALILALQEALAMFTQGQTIAVAASTLAVFAMFQPLRRRIQRAVDRRFDRAKYDADLTINGFSSRLRQDVDLGVVRGEIVQAAGAAVRPTAAAIWLRGE